MIWGLRLFILYNFSRSHRGRRMTLPAFFDYEFLGNTLSQYLLAGFILLIGAALRQLLSKLLSKVLFRITKRYTAGVSEPELHDLLIQPLSVLLFLVTIYVAFGVLRYPMPPSAVPGK
jgi:MscS family membrane protein